MAEDTQELGRVDLSGQVAIVTGGGRGIGRAVAEGLAKAGVAVAVAARSLDQLDETVELISGAGGRALAFPLDVADPSAVRKLVADVEEQLGPVDLLVNNAGVAGTVGPIWEIDAEEWWRCFEVNLRGAMLCASTVLPSMTARRRGCIINMSSGAALNPWRYVSAYAISKAALDRLSENIALEVAEYNTSVFSVSPGTIRTAMTDTSTSSEWQQWDQTVAEIFARGDGITTEPVVRLVLTLASGVADALSGRHISVFDDLSEMLKRVDEIKERGLYTLRSKKLSS